MQQILSITAPIYLSIALGWLAVRTGLFAAADMRALGRFVLHVALPALLLDAVARQPLADLLHLPYLAVFALGSLLALAVGMVWLRVAARQPPLKAAVLGMGMCCANSGFVGLPINAMLLGAPLAGLVLGMNMLVENLLVIPLLLALMDAAGGGGDWRASVRATACGILRALPRNPLVLALAAGMCLSALGVQLPAVGQRTVGLFAQASAALSLFVIGGSLAAQPLRGLGWLVAQAVAGKLLLHPLMVWLALCALQALGVPALSPQLKTAVVLAAACPCFGLYPILVQRHGGEGVAAAVQLGSTAASFFTISALMWWMGV